MQKLHAMSRWLRRRDDLWPLWVALFAGLTLVMGLGSFGLWEPQEIKLADEARVSLEQEDLDVPPPLPEAPDEAEPESEPGAAGKGKRATPVTPASGPKLPSTLPFHRFAVSRGIDLIGPTELGVRLPLALLGLGLVLATYLLGMRIGGTRRAGLFSAIVVLGMPLLVFQSRQVTSDIGTAAGQTFLIAGLIGVVWPKPGRHRGLEVWLSILLAAIGAVVAATAGGVLLGLLPPLLAAAIGVGGMLALGRWLGDAARANAVSTAAAIRPRFAIGRRRTIAPPSLPWAQILVGTFAALAAAAAVVVFCHEVFQLRDAVEGERNLFGVTMVPENGYIDVIGGVWKTNDDLAQTFDSLFEQIGYGMFPWAALVPIALWAMLSRGGREVARGDARGNGGRVLVGWALLSWAAAAVVERKIGPAMYPGFAACAIAVGVWLDELLLARAARDADATPLDAAGDASLRGPLVALFALLAAIVLARDLTQFPDKLASLHIADGSAKYPDKLAFFGVDLKLWLIPFALMVTGALAAALWLWQPAARKQPPGVRFIGRHGVTGAVLASVLFSLFLAHGWTPTLSRALSSKHVLSILRDQRKDGERLGVMNGVGGGVEYYAQGDYEKIAGRPALIDFLREMDRVWALVPNSELCSIHRSAGSEHFEYHVIDDSNSKFLLLSNQLGESTDKNVLSRAILREPPADIQIPLSATFDDKIELIGASFPRTVDRGETFDVTLYFKVLKNVGGNWRIFAHFDGPGPLRFQGDHEPIGGRCSTSFWQEGDYIVDTFSVEAGGRAFSKADHKLWVGFFTGGGGNWKNMPVSAVVAPVEKDSTNRVSIGAVKLD